MAIMRNVGCTDYLFSWCLSRDRRHIGEEEVAQNQIIFLLLMGNYTVIVQAYLPGLEPLWLN